MKTTRKTVATNPDATRFIGWNSDDIESILSLIPNLFNEDMYSK